MADLDLDDIQGLIVRGYRKPVARHVLLTIQRSEAFRAMLGDLADEDHSSGPFVTVAADWMVKPPAGVVPTHCVNIGFTFAGLQALGLSDASLGSFPEEFKQGAVQRAAVVGDTGPSAPEHWVPSLVSPDAHVLLSISADSEAELDAVSAEVRGRANGAATELDRFDGRFLPGEAAHFGYRDGISQPTIQGCRWPASRTRSRAHRRASSCSATRASTPATCFPCPSRTRSGATGASAFRILRQDVHGFETFLELQSAQAGIDKELLAAKICGRWRNGVPLVMSPDTASPDPPIPPEKLNFFDYEKTDSQQEYSDPRGQRCPIGSHIRRANPRSARVAGSGLSHRIVRRGLPYGPPYDPEHPDDGHERGMVGMFIGVDLKDQFEFVMGEWINDGTFAPGLGSTKDPLMGANAQDSRFTIPGMPAVSGFSRFVTTRGRGVLLPSQHDRPAPHGRRRRRTASHMTTRGVR